ncbi:unnamed protein product [Allacma fusca]|uniref:Uncharacterized protein n=1 Tax=Allacma fusca TaxID=39272 RepID=A0A8J2KQU5_9HEXA|nr:unnamed protein product [Allacma fusca]
MKDSNNTMECAIDKGLRYLETLYEKKPWAFSATSYTRDRKIFTDSYDYKFTGLPETFTHFLALDLLGKHLSPLVRSKLVDSLRPSKLQTLNYFVDPSRFPDDVDTTVLGYTTLLKARVLTEDNVLPVAETVFGNVDDNNGLVELHFKSAEKRRQKIICACVCSNVLHFAYTIRQESKLQKTEDYVFDWLKSGNWKQGTLYYPSGFPFLYYCSNFVKMNYKVQRRFGPVLLSAIKDSLKDCRLPLDYALLLLALENLGERDYSEEISEILLGLQEDDGSYAPDAIWGDRHGVLYGGKAFSTIIIIGALASAARFC